MDHCQLTACDNCGFYKLCPNPAMKAYDNWFGHDAEVRFYKIQGKIRKAKLKKLLS